MVEIPGRREDDIAAAEAVTVIAEELCLLQPAHGLLCSQDRLAQRMTPPEILREDLVDQVVGVVLVHLDLFKDHAPLALDIAFGKDRMQAPDR